MTSYSSSSVGLNPMVRRQTARSKFTHFQPVEGDAFDELLKLVAGCLTADDAVVKVLRPDGLIIKLRLPEQVCEGRFFTSIVKLEVGMQVRSVVAVRPGGLPGELPYLQSVVVGARKTPSKWVDVILYHRDALKLEERLWTPPGKTEPEPVDADWQVVSVNAHITEADEPATPQAMARNHSARLGLPEGVGGSPRQYTDEDYRVSNLFWGSHAMVEGEE